MHKRRKGAVGNGNGKCIKIGSSEKNVHKQCYEWKKENKNRKNKWHKIKNKRNITTMAAGR